MKTVKSILLFVLVYLVSWTFGYEVITRGFEAGITLLIAILIASFPWVYARIDEIDSNAVAHTRDVGDR